MYHDLVRICLQQSDASLDQRPARPGYVADGRGCRGGQRRADAGFVVELLQRARQGQTHLRMAVAKQGVDGHDRQLAGMPAQDRTQCRHMGHQQVILHDEQVDVFHGPLLAGRFIEHAHECRAEGGQAVHQALALDAVGEIIEAFSLQQREAGLHIAEVHVEHLAHEAWQALVFPVGQHKAEHGGHRRADQRVDQAFADEVRIAGRHQMHLQQDHQADGDGRVAVAQIDEGGRGHDGEK